MTAQKYLFVILIFLCWGIDAQAQCLTIPNAIQSQIASADRIVEGRVLSQESWIGPDGNIQTTNTIQVHRVFKGHVEVEIEVVTEGGVVGNLMQIVTPSANFTTGDFGLFVVANDDFRDVQSLALAFYPIDVKGGAVYEFENMNSILELYELIHRLVGQASIQVLEPTLVEQIGQQRASPEIESINPLSLTAGTRSVLTITGQGFGNEQGTGFVAFRNANDGGQSFVAMPSGPHYLSWSDSEIQMYVPSTSLYSSTVAGTGQIRVVNNLGNAGQSTHHLTVSFAQSEVVYTESLNETQLVGIVEGGYLFRVNPALQSLMGGLPMARQALEKWSCNTRVNFDLSEELSNQSSFANDGINLLGLSVAGQLPSYMLGRAVTTFSGCGTTSGILWNLIEVDIIMNGDINWWTSGLNPMANSFDLSTALLHELGHAHLLQHNSNVNSPMYYQLTAGSMKRELHAEADIAGGNYITNLSVETSSNCGNDKHEFQEENGCNMSQINGLEGNETLQSTAYPNPFNDFLNITGTWNDDATFEIVDALGRSVASGQVTSGLQRIDTAWLIRGFYVLHLSDSLGQQSIRLIKN